MTEEEDTAVGRQAIGAALERIYGDAVPLHAGTEHPWALGGPDPIDGIDFYPRTEPVPHWHLVGYGMTELYTKQTDDPAESGWGFEFTVRVARAPEDERPPMWAAVLLQSLGRYVFRSGNPFAAGHTMRVGRPLGGPDSTSQVHALAFTEDPELGAIGTPHGRVRFLQVVGLTLDEYEAARGGNAAEVLRALEPRLPLYITDIGRGSLLAAP
ncbi:suppressor of fused domain protein [Nocardiopsis sp. CNT-189]|uniref:suppressor of fused domain protein n=1 Tax=Nocardiopsis oceanisediminis TaxID=2816862 RepID=UPI003B2FCDCF